MKHFFTLLLISIMSLSGFAQNACTDCSHLIFKENKGQWDKRILFNADMKGGNVLLEKKAITYNLFSLEDLMRIRGDQHHQHLYTPYFDKTFHCHAFKVNFENANDNIGGDGLQKIGEYFNYFLGNDRSKWASRVSGFQEVIFRNLYDGISLRIFSQKANLKYDFIVGKGADASAILLHYEGVDEIKLQDEKLYLTTSLGQAVEQKPYAYQLVNGKEKEVRCQYRLASNKVSFYFPDGYDSSYDLIIDPTLIFSTFSGSFADNFGYSATYDSHKNAYAAGSVFINQALGGYPVTLGAYQTTWAGGSGAGTLSGTDIGITKYSADGTSRIYSTYLGGVSDELPHSLIVNGNDELFIFGTTSSNNFPVTPNAYDTTYNGGPNPGPFNGLGVHYEFGSDIIISRLSSDGTQLLASTYVGGSGMDGLNISNPLLYNYADQVRGEIDIDHQNNVYVVTCSGSSDFPIIGSTFQPTYGGGLLDGVVIKMNNNLTSIIWSTFLGGSGDDAAYSVSLDKNDDLFISGGTQSTNFPITPLTLQQTNAGGDCDGFITHITKNGQQVIRSSYYGYPDYDQTYFVEVNRNNEVFLLGQAESSDSFYIKNSLYNVKNGGLYISKIGFNLDTIIWSTSLGKPTGRPDISPTAFLVDLCNKVYVAGWGGAVNGFGGTRNLPITIDAYQSTTDNSDFYLMVIEDDASALSYATYFGGPQSAEHVDGGTSRFDEGGIIYQSVCAGCGGHSDFPIAPIPGAVSSTNNSPNCNNGIFKFDFNLPIVLADFNVTTTCVGLSSPFVNTSSASDSASYLWNFGDGITSNAENPSHIFSQPGEYEVSLIVTDPGTCNATDTALFKVQILNGGGMDSIPSVTICNGQLAQIGFPPNNDTTVTYLWSPASTLSDIDISNPVANPLTTTTYRLLLSNGVCTDTFYQTVVVFNDALSLDGSDVLCPGDTLQLSVHNAQSGQQLSYSWSPQSQIISGANTNAPLVRPTQDLTYTVTVTNQLGCVFIDSIRINVISSLPDVDAFAIPDTILFGDTSQLSLVLSPNVSGFEWQQDSTLSSATIENPLAYPSKTTAYYVTVYDNQGCYKRDTVWIFVLNEPCKTANLYIPNAFSPNKDGKNDLLFVRGNGITDLYFAIYDRWGQKVFETYDQSKGWDGTFGGKKLDPAVFGYYAEGTCEGGDKFFKKGNVTLLK